MRGLKARLAENKLRLQVFEIAYLELSRKKITTANSRIVRVANNTSGNKGVNVSRKRRSRSSKFAEGKACKGWNERTE